MRALLDIIIPMENLICSDWRSPDTCLLANSKLIITSVASLISIGVNRSYKVNIIIIYTVAVVKRGLQCDDVGEKMKKIII